MSRQLDAYTENLLNEDSCDEDELLQQLEDELEDDVMTRYREQRLQQLADQFKQVDKNVEKGFGSVESILDEKDVLKITTQTKYTVVHFYLPSFKMCQTMDEKLKVLAYKHLFTKFIKINVEDAPFLVSKLNIKVLPCVYGYINGAEALKLVGFTKLGNSENFSTETLESVLLASGVLQRRANTLNFASKKVLESDDDSDMD